MIYNVLDYGVKANSDELQTDKLQKVLDMCKLDGGQVIFPAGRYVTAALRVWSDTTVLLKSGAEVIGSADCNDYEVFAPPEKLGFYTDNEFFPNADFLQTSPEEARGKMRFYHDGELVGFDPEHSGRAEYRRAIFTAYGEENIKFVGEENSVLDGVDCFDPDGAEGLRGPHVFFMSSCRNLVFEGYTVKRAANFAHQFDACVNVELRNVRVTAGHDGVHLNACENMVIKDCVFETGDDCIAGVNVRNISVADCYLNTACNVFRIGGVNIDIRRCKAEGEGKYPHRLSLLKDGKILPEKEGRRNTLFFMEFFASEVMPMRENCGVTVTDCEISGIDSFLHYEAENKLALHTGARLTRMTLENIAVKGIKSPSSVKALPESKLHINMKNVSVNYRDEKKNGKLFDNDENTVIKCE